MEIWVAKDEDGGCWMFIDKPKRRAGRFFTGNCINKTFEGLFPGLTWENSPKQYEIKEVIENDDR